MRITGGAARNIRLHVPEENTRPATDAMRESIFSSLGTIIEDASVLDLFAGSGAYGLESFSRGASSVCFVEKSRKAISSIKRNIDAVKKSVSTNETHANLRSIQGDIFKWKVNENILFDIIFVDPPYELLNAKFEKCIQYFSEKLNQSENSRLILEAPAEYNAIEIPGLELLKRLGKKSSRQPSALIYARNS